MYKFVTIQGSCGNPYDVGKCEDTANKMQSNGFDLVQVYQSSTSGCFSTKSILVMIFKKRGE